MRAKWEDWKAGQVVQSLTGQSEDRSLLTEMGLERAVISTATP